MSWAPGHPSSFQPRPLSQPLHVPPSPPRFLSRISLVLFMLFPPSGMLSCPLPPALPPAQIYFRLSSKSSCFWKLSLVPQCKLPPLKPRTFYFSYETHDIWFVLLFHTCIIICVHFSSCATSRAESLLVMGLVLP